MRVVVLLCLLAGLAYADEPRSATGYHHGKPYALSVVTIDGADVEVHTAQAYEKMRAAAQKAGVVLRVHSGFRTQDHQAWLYSLWRAGWGNRAAKPGWSNHQSGRALDLVVDDDGTFAWLIRHGWRYGFRRTVRGEPWHWEYVGRPRARRRR
jgi:LAS superfamily LD-carboxypeptidase LdcB